MRRVSVVLLLIMLLPACGRPVRPLAAVPAAVAMAEPIVADGESARSVVQDCVDRFLARKHPGAVVIELKVARKVQNGMLAFTAMCRSARQTRRIEGHYDVATRVARVESDTLLP